MAAVYASFGNMWKTWSLLLDIEIGGNAVKDLCWERREGMLMLDVGGNVAVG